MEEGLATKWLLVWRTGKLQPWRTLYWPLPGFFNFHYDIETASLEVRCDEQLYRLSPLLLLILCRVRFTRQQGQEKRTELTLRNKSSSILETGRKALPLACCCLSERKARRPWARCPLSVHTLPSAASCFVTQHGSMGYRDGGVLRSAADQLTWIRRNFLY